MNRSPFSSTHARRISGKATLACLASLLALMAFNRAKAASLLPDTILVSRLDSHQVIEYTPAGAVVQMFNVPTVTGQNTESTRDVIVDGSGRVQIYNGTFDPYITTLTPTTGALSSRTFPGFSTVNNVSFGGIAARGRFVFATDMRTFGDDGTDEASGIIRFDFSTNTAGRFAEADGYQDLTIGGDGLLYALPGEGLPAGHIDVFDPSSLNLLRSINFLSASPDVRDADVRGLAVGFDGTIYVAAWNGFVYALDHDGFTLNSRDTGFGNLTDIDLNATGQLVIGSRFGDVILTDITLATQTSFNVDNQEFGETIHVAWSRTIPEPSIGQLLVMVFGLGLIVARWRGQRLPSPHGNSGP